jgi:hypothetical protein
LQEPPQAPFVQTNWQAVGSFTHVPAAVHVCTVLPMHCLAPGMQAVHVPWLQTGLHAAPLFSQSPLALHFWGCVPLHCIEPGVQVPVHMFEVQT